MSLIVFMYHRILPQEYRESISMDLFRRQLDHLQKHFTFLSPSQVEEYIRGTLSMPGPCAALSFDDAWADNLFYAQEELKKRSLSSFLAVSAGCLHDGPVRTGESDEVLYRSMKESQAASRAGDCRSYCSRAELRSMQESGVWQLEVHGTRHELGDRGASILACPQNGMDAAAFRAFLKDDLLSAKGELSRITGREHHIFFWPWGHYSASAVKIAEECGFDIQFTVTKGAVRNGDTRKVLPRVGVPPRWKKFVKNAFVFRHKSLAAIHDCFHKEKVLFDELFDK